MSRKRIEPDLRYGNSDDLFRRAKQTKSLEESRRFNAIRLLMLGRTREDVMETFAASWSTLQQWVRLWNKGGEKNPRTAKRPGRPSRLTSEGRQLISEKVEFTNPKTGERITAIRLSGVLEKKVADKIKAKYDLLSSQKNGVCPDKAKT